MCPWKIIFRHSNWEVDASAIILGYAHAIYNVICLVLKLNSDWVKKIPFRWRHVSPRIISLFIITPNCQKFLKLQHFFFNGKIYLTLWESPLIVPELLGDEYKRIYFEKPFVLDIQKPRKLLNCQQRFRKC